MSKKIVGITGPSVYSNLVKEMVSEAFGAIPLDINQDGKENIEQIASLCDSFIFAGGNDIAPMSMGREITGGNCYSKFDPKRDRREFCLMDFAKENGKKIFGICRGHQMLLSRAGMSLIPDISRYSEVCHNPKEIETNGEPIHFLYGFGNGLTEFFPKSLVNSYHHQAIDFNLKQAAAAKVEILGYSYTNYPTKEKPGGHKIVELARGEGFFCCQNHPEIDYKYVESSAKIVEAAKSMFGF